MCDYSLEHLVSRAANVGDKLVTTSFGQGLTGGFCAMDEPNVTVWTTMLSNCLADRSCC
jgi:hypothetical protein